MKGAYLQWQAQEGRLAEARQRLNRSYLLLRRQARQAQIEPYQGVLRVAQLLLDQAFDPVILMLKGRLARMFALRGQGLCRRVPPLLEVELSHYLANIEKICRSHSELEVRLRLAQAIMSKFSRSQEFCGPRFFRLALISPESAWLFFHLRQKRLKDRRVIQDLV